MRRESRKRERRGRKGIAPTVRTIAEIARVSPSTVSKALNGRPGLSARQRLRIRKIAEDLGYRPYGAARRTGMHLAGGRHLAVLCGPVGAHISREVETGIDSALRSSDLFEVRCRLLPGDSSNEAAQEAFLRKVDEDPSVAGLLAAFVDLPRRTVSALGRRGVPIVSLDASAAARAPGSVSIDHAAAAAAAVRAFLDLGRRRIGYVGQRAGIGWVFAARLEGARAALADAGLALEFEDEPYAQAAEAAFATRRLLDRAPETDAVLYASDLQAIGGMKMLREMGVEVPGRVAVIGFDDIEACTAVVPSLSSVRQPFRRMGERGTHMLLRAAAGDAAALRSETLETRLVLRASCLDGYAGDRWYRAADGAAGEAA